jgi:5-methylcytosine-specific restriction endonuclease McrA
MAETKETIAAKKAARRLANIEIHRENDRIRYQANRQKKLIQKKGYYAENRKQKISYQMEWNRNNRDKTKKYNKKWVSTHREEARAVVRNRDAKKRKSGGKHTGAEIKDLAVKQNHKCANSSCMVSLKGRYHVDHVIPIALGGRNDIGNIQLLCPPCNRSKSAKHPIDWAREHGRLL